jgi:hypothetical protein
LLCTLLLACGTGVGVYLYLADHYAHAKVADAAAPRPVPTPAPAEAPVEEAAAEPVVEPPAPVPIPAPADPADPNAVPDELDAAQIEATIAAARNRFVDCEVLGRVTLTLKIRPSGRVEQVTVDGAESDEMRTCLVTATKRIKFGRSTKGLTARYTLVGG